jgi:hypothetical protein
MTVGSFDPYTDLAVDHPSLRRVYASSTHSSVWDITVIISLN